MKYIFRNKLINFFILISIIIALPLRSYGEVKDFTLDKSEEVIINDNNQETSKIGAYKEGEVIVTYKKERFLQALNISANSFINNYNIVDTVLFEDVIAEKTGFVSKDNSSKNSEEISSVAMSLIKSSKHTTEELIKILKDESWVISVLPNFIMQTTSLTNDPYTKFQWAIENTGQTGNTPDKDINPISTTSDEERVIAIVDSGVDYTHEDLRNIMWQNPYGDKLQGTCGYDFVEEDEYPMDFEGHGTHVAGIIAAEANNNIGTTGTVLGASNIKIMALKVGDDNGNFELYSVLEAYNYIYNAQKLGTKIVAINNSWGSYILVDNSNGIQFTDTLTSVINLVGEQGALSVCASGNDGVYINENGECWIPAYTENGPQFVYAKEIPAGIQSEYVISVAASSSDDTLSFFSNYGPKIDIAAPGYNILSTSIESESKFFPDFLNEEEKQKISDLTYVDFENEDSIDNDLINNIFKTNNGTISVTDETSCEYGVNCLKWEFDVTDENSIAHLDINASDATPKHLGLTVKGGTGTSGYIECLSDFWYNGDEWGSTETFGGIQCIDGSEWTHLGSSREKMCTFNNDLSSVASLVLEKPKQGHYVFYLDNIGMTSDENATTPYEYKMGTSMAAPFVSGALGTISNLYENDTTLQLKDRLLNSVRRVEDLQYKIWTTSGVLDLSHVADSIFTTGIDISKNYDGSVIAKLSEDKGCLTIEGTGEMRNWKKDHLFLRPWNSYLQEIHQVSIEEGITNIGDFSFKDCSSLINANISKVANIGKGVFNGCGELISIEVDNENEQYITEDGILFDKEKGKIIRYPSKKEDTKYKMPDSVEIIEFGAFEGCSNLIEVTIPERVWTIGEQAFYNCEKLEMVKMPDSLMEISAYTFANCKSLRSMEIPGSNCEILDHAFENCESLTNIIIPKEVHSISSDSFDGCNNLTITCKRETFAERYAKNHNINYTIDDELSITENKEVLDNNQIRVTLQSEEFLRPLAGWTLEEDRKTLTRIYNGNNDDEVYVLDLVGNGETITLEITIPVSKNLPIVNIEGDISTLTTDKNEERFVLSYTDENTNLNFTKNVTMKLQEEANLLYPKHSFSIEVYSDNTFSEKEKINMNKGWGESDKYCLNSNVMDYTQARNIVTSNLAADVQERYGLFTNEKIPNNGLIDGYPVQVHINGEFYGLYTWNIPKDAWMWNIDKNDVNNIVVQGNANNSDYTLFKKEIEENVSMLDANWKIIEGCDSEENIKVKFNRLLKFVSESSDEEFKAHFEDYLNKDALLNYLVFVYVAEGWDNIANNMTLVTYDGNIWYPTFYDLDSTWGRGAQNYNWVPEDTYTEEWGKQENILIDKFMRCFPNQFAERYFDIRENELSEETIKNTFDNYCKQIPNESYELDKEKWENTSGYGKTATLNQIYGFIDVRLPYVDNIVNQKNTQQIKGDVNGNGTVDMTDYSMILKHVKGIKILTGELLERADVNQNGSIDMTDYSMILKHVKGIKLLN